MVKVCQEDFPMGSYPGQRDPGFYINHRVKDNLDVLARNITNDMQFVGLYTGDGTVRNGKSTCAMQHAYYYSWKISQLTGKKVPFTAENIVFRAKDLIDRAFNLPRYSCIILDEGDDLTAHYFSKLAQELKKFFRKCGQLNLFIILILPNFFELPKNYALTRSNYLCNVYFTGEFKRGFFNFYGMRRKKHLYLKGKKEEDYQAAPKGFSGRFIKLYPIDEEAYREAKLKDMMLTEEEEEPFVKKARLIKEGIVKRIYEKYPDMSNEDMAKIMDLSERQIFRYKRTIKKEKLEKEAKRRLSAEQSFNYPIVARKNKNVLAVSPANIILDYGKEEG